MKILILFIFITFIIVSCFDNGSTPNGSFTQDIYLYGEVRDSLTNQPIDSALVASRYYYANPNYFDKIAKLKVPSNVLEDLCTVVNYSDSTGSIKLKFRQTIYDRGPNNFSTDPISEVLIAYKPGYKIWIFDKTRDTLSFVYYGNTTRPIKMMLTTIKLSKL